MWQKYYRQRLNAACRTSCAHRRALPYKHMRACTCMCVHGRKNVPGQPSKSKYSGRTPPLLRLRRYLRLRLCGARRRPTAETEKSYLLRSCAPVCVVLMVFPQWSHALALVGALEPTSQGSSGGRRTSISRKIVCGIPQTNKI